MKLLVAGPGAIGLLFGTKLKKSGNEVTYLAGSNEAKEELEKGVVLKNKENLEDKPRVLTELEGENFDFVLITVKAYKIREVVPQLSRAKFKAILVLSNGMGYEEDLTVFGKKVIYGVTEMGATRFSRREIELRGRGKTYIGITSPFSLKIGEILEGAGFEIELADSINSIRLGKLFINSIINPITAVFRVRNGEIIENKYLRELAIKLAEEDEKLRDRLGLELPYAKIEDKLFEVVEKTSENLSSMLQDIEWKRKTEIDYITGYILRLGEEELSLPLNRAFYLLVKALEENLALGSTKDFPNLSPLVN